MNDWLLFIALSAVGFGLPYLFTRFIKNNPNPLKNLWFWISGFMLSIILYAGLVLILLGLDKPPSSESFSSIKWKSHPNERVKMIDKVINLKLLNNLRTKEVIKLLGKPDGGNYTIKGTYTYYLGPERGFMSIDSEWLSIWFKDGKVNRIRVWKD